MWLVLSVESTHELNLFGRKQSLDLVWADGMVGVCPVFETKEEAIGYASNNTFIVEVSSCSNDKEGM